MPRYLLESLFVIVLVLWLFGAFITPFGGSLIHFLLVLVAVIVVMRILQGRRVLE